MYAISVVTVSHCFNRMRNSFARPLRRSGFCLLGFAILILGAACAPPSKATPFRPPTSQAPFIEPTLIISPTRAVVVVQSSPLPTILPTVDSASCTNDLAFIEDLTIPDNSTVALGAPIDKQWLVANSGTCNWTVAYRLKHIGGAVLGAPEEIALYPARAGAQARIQILFSAPFSEGIYESAWQAHGPDGTAFGDPIYIRILVP